jgi:uncharacterized damage-inducible protein DinB
MDHAGTEPTLTAGAQDAWVEPRVDDAGSLTRRAARVKRKHRKRENQAMITPAYVRTMAEYNAEMNRRLYGAAGGLSDAERRADRGAFFHSIHGTLAHLLWGDAQWMSRFDDWPRPATPIKESDRYIADWGELCAPRQKADADIAGWAARVDDSWFDGDMSWPSQAAGRFGHRRERRIHILQREFCIGMSLPDRQHALLIECEVIHRKSLRSGNTGVARRERQNWAGTE